MAIKFDQQKTKQQLFHLSISLATVLVCMTYLQFRRNWLHVGKFWESFVIPIVFTGELLKVILTRYCDRSETNVLTMKQRQKKAAYFSAREILGGLFVQFFCTIMYAFICIVLGAPVLQNYEQTFVLSMVLTLMTVSPTVFLLGGGGTLQVCFCEKCDFLTKSEEISLNLFKYNALGAIFGAWAASVVAPLDWDREWQEYPIPNVIGALLGCGLGNIYVCSKVLYSTAKVYYNKKRL